MEVRVSLAPWFPIVLDIYTRMLVMGYRLSEEDIDRLVKSAVIVEVE